MLAQLLLASERQDQTKSVLIHIQHLVLVKFYSLEIPAKLYGKNTIP